MSDILVVVDVQNDFVDGSLGSKEAQEIIPYVVQEIESGKYTKIFVTLDTHQENYLETFEGKHLPVKHCIKDSDGWKVNEKVQEALNQVECIYVEKPTFGSQKLVEKIVDMKPETVTFVGLCTDICVLSNALLTRAALYQTPIQVLSKACAGVTKEKHEAALEVMKSCQIDIL